MKTPKHSKAIRVYLWALGYRTHDPLDGCEGCHKYQVIRDTIFTTGDPELFRVLLRLIVEDT